MVGYDLQVDPSVVEGFAIARPTVTSSLTAVKVEDHYEGLDLKAEVRHRELEKACDYLVTGGCSRPLSDPDLLHDCCLEGHYCGKSPIPTFGNKGFRGNGQ